MTGGDGACVVADLHTHLPMHVEPTVESGAFADRLGLLRDRWRYAAVSAAGRFGNLERATGRPRVSIPLLREGGVGIALSVLYSPFDEMILGPGWHLREMRNRGRRYHWAPPGPRAYPRLLRQLESIERHVAGYGDLASIVRDRAGLESALAAGKVAVVHCVEGGFHVSHAASVDRAVAEFARRGVAYITLGHLYFKSVATVAPAWAAVSQARWHAIWPQPHVGLTDAGRAVVRAMVRNRVLLDVAHLSSTALEQVFALLDELDPEHTVPVLASHVALRFGDNEYNLADETVERIAARDGVVGLIASAPHLADGGKAPASFEDTCRALFRHIDRLRSLTGSHRHAAIGTDLGGFITPAPGVENVGRLGALRRALGARYGEQEAELIASGNVLRLLLARWSTEDPRRR